MRPGYNEWQLHKAAVVAMRSRDPSTKCGAVIIRPNKTACSEGYNGFPKNMEDRVEWYENRAEKYDRVIHAEMNAIKHANEDIEGYAIFITRPPCKDCAKHIASWGLAEVVWSDHSERSLPAADKLGVERGKHILDDCGVNRAVVHQE